MKKIEMFNFSIGEKKNKPKKLTKQELSDKLILAQSELEEKKDELLQIYKERGEGFTKQIRYLDVLEEQKEEISKLKDNIKELKAQNKEYKNRVNEYVGSVLKISPSVSKCKSKEDVFSYIEVYYVSDEEIPLEEICKACDKLKITKTSIKNYNEDIYNELKVKNWNIGE